MEKKLLISLVLGLGWLSLQTFSQCNADFSFEVDDNEVIFTNLSEGYGKKVLWDYGDSKFAKDSTEVKHKYKNPGDYDVTLTIFNEETGCFDMITKTVSINPEEIKCSAKFSIIPDEVDEFTFTFKPDYISDGNYYWDLGDGNSNSLSEITYTYNSPGIYKISLTVDDPENGCIRSNKKVLNVALDKLKVKANFEYFYDIDSDSIYLINFSVGNIVSYVWDLGNRTVLYDKNPKISIDDIESLDVCLTVFDGEGNYSSKCKEIEYYASDKENPEFEVYIFPTSNQIKVRAFINDPESEYFWDFGDGTSEEGSEVVHTYLDTGIYLIHFQRYTGVIKCQKFKLVNIHSLFKNNIAAFKLITESSLKTTSDKARPRGILSGDISRFKWSLNNIAVDSTKLSPVIDYTTDDDSISICLTVYNDYLNSERTYCQWIKLNNTTEVIDLVNEAVSDCFIYPNPAKDVLNVNYFTPYNSDININIYNISGKLTINKNYFSQSEGLNNCQIDISTLSKGLYVIMLSSETISESIKFLIIE